MRKSFFLECFKHVKNLILMVSYVILLHIKIIQICFINRTQSDPFFLTLRKTDRFHTQPEQITKIFGYHRTAFSKVFATRCIGMFATIERKLCITKKSLFRLNEARWRQAKLININFIICVKKCSE